MIMTMMKAMMRTYQYVISQSMMESIFSSENMSRRSSSVCSLSTTIQLVSGGWEGGREGGRTGGRGGSEDGREGEREG